ncbi:adenosine deaminase [Corynebacterium silvaticum]|nr:adenosine deaminase [Corynebacterium silvaticum]NON70437.1 adenosine deaminase [Corynebacterium silvaticum]UWH00721.1 adenosine deaminase [Corynebacterium silvaticum]UWH02768.1 adenosine deaminase [Corynebacterium silvaticum]UWH04808.1 adenosine deaminase [Corynebacterium silvaticum]UXZ26967.1 adenosine deaminase [Corynebacterium silvaticum]
MYDTPDFRTEFKILKPELLHAMPKVILGDAGDAAYLIARIRELGDDTVAYYECTVPLDAAAAAIAAVEAAPFPVGIVLDLGDQPAPLDDLTHPAVLACVTSDDHTARVLRENLIAYDFTGPLEQQIHAGATRITHGIELFDDFCVTDGDLKPGHLSAWVLDRRIPVLTNPFEDLESGDLDDLSDHPLPLMHKLGFHAAPALLSSDRMLELVEHFDYSIEDLYALTMTAVAVSYLPEPARVKLIESTISPFFAMLSDDDNGGAEDLAEDIEDSEDLEKNRKESSILSEPPLELIAEMGIDLKDLGLKE